jgi:pimeloyl-ACP methyl ester carboxylesterase
MRAKLDVMQTKILGAGNSILLSNETKLAYQVIEPGDYQLELESSLETDTFKFNFSFTKSKELPEPHGTIILLHGYYLDRSSMIPWGLYFAQHGYRSILVDLRGHGDSSGDSVTFGQEERYELKELLNALGAQNIVEDPVGVFGYSYGAVMAIQWAWIDSRIQSIVAVSPYNDPTQAIQVLAKQFAPSFVSGKSIRKGIGKMEERHGIHWDELVTEDFIRNSGPPIYFVRGGRDTVCTPSVERALLNKAPEGSGGLQVARVPHEVLFLVFNELKESSLKWFHHTMGVL